MTVWVAATALGVLDGLVCFILGRRYEQRCEMRRKIRIWTRWGERP